MYKHIDNHLRTPLMRPRLPCLSSHKNFRGCFEEFIGVQARILLKNELKIAAYLYPCHSLSIWKSQTIEAGHQNPTRVHFHEFVTVQFIPGSRSISQTSSDSAPTWQSLQAAGSMDLQRSHMPTCDGKLNPIRGPNPRVLTLVIPPSTTKSVPFTKLLSSLARKRTA